MDEPVTLERFDGPRGEVVLRRRGIGDDAVEELIINGAFAMDSAETSTERQLARVALENAPAAGRMLIGGLGLGYTATEALLLGVGRVVVLEIEDCLVHWARRGATAIWAQLDAESRVQLVIGDIVDVLVPVQGDSGSGPLGSSEPLGPWDAIVLDVDNGPDFLIHPQNASLYSPELLCYAYERLRPGGRLAIWCQAESPELLARLSQLAPTAAQRPAPVQRGSRRFDHVICTLDRPLT